MNIWKSPQNQLDCARNTSLNWIEKRILHKNFTTMPTISFQPKKITKKITANLQDRASDVIMHRFGLTSDGKRKTLEEIGKKYNITRERVRQVEDVTIKSIKKSDAYLREQVVFDELRHVIKKLGSIVAEHELLP